MVHRARAQFSELPMDRMSNTGFSQAGFSESTNSTPKSEAPDEVDRAEEEANAEQVALDADAARAARGLTLKEVPAPSPAAAACSARHTRPLTGSSAVLCRRSAGVGLYPSIGTQHVHTPTALAERCHSVRAAV